MNVLASFLTLLVAAAASVFDLRSGLIPNKITYPGLGIILAIALLNGSLKESLVGALTTGGALLLLHLVTSGRGIGLGDVKLAACIGAGMGPLPGATALAYAFILGGCFAGILLLTRRCRRGHVVCFGPFLAAGALGALCIPPEISLP